MNPEQAQRFVDQVSALLDIGVTTRTKPYYVCPIPSCPNTLPKQPLASPYPPHCTGNGTHKPTEMKKEAHDA